MILTKRNAITALAAFGAGMVVYHGVKYIRNMQPSIVPVVNQTGANPAQPAVQRAAGIGGT